MTSWEELAGRLADTLAAAGHLSDQRWRQAFTAVPRHVFVPRFVRDDNTVVDGADPDQRHEWLTTVYSDISLTTQTQPVPGTDLQWATSSSTRPSLMAHMLHLLDIADRQRVLEIGTGTGYHAALLCHRLGPTNITSIDIHPELVNTAQQLLASLGYRPHLSAGDGALGTPTHAPYHRIVATCAVPAVPAAWIAQLSGQGVIVTDIRGELCSSLTVLRKTDDKTVQGRFLAVPGHFMWLRTQADNPLRTGGTLPVTVDHDGATTTTTDLAPTILDHPDLRFLLQHLDPGVAQIWRSSREGTEQTHLSAADGSWAEITTAHQRHTVTQGGPRPLWDLTEHTAHLWVRLGRPARHRFGLTATSDGTHLLWLDHPDSEHHWRLNSQ